MSLVEDRREKMANQLLARGWATMRELLEMSFGEWPVKGLEIDAGVTHGQKFTFVPCDDQDCLASVHPLNGRHTIHYTRELSKILKNNSDESLHDILGHEALHALQQKGVYLKSESIFVRAVGHSLPVFLYQLLFAKTRAAKIGKDFAKKAKTLKDEFDQETRKGLKYLSHGDELQARLHEIMMDGYPWWGRLPQNNYEFTLVLAASGATGVKVKFNSDTNAPLPSVFATEMNTPVANEIAHVALSLCKSNKERGDFVDLLTALYVNMLELYGDKNARARFGLDKNYKPIAQKPAPASAGSTPSPA